MNSRQLKQSMKKQIRAVLLGVCFTLAATASSHAMSQLISLSLEPLWPTSSTPDGYLVYNVTTIGRGGAGLLQVTLTAGAMPPGTTVTFSPDVLRFTGNQITAQTGTIRVYCPSLVPLDAFPFTLTATAQRESITITNLVMFSPQYIAVRPAILCIDDLKNSNLRVRGLGASGKTYQIESTSDLSNPAWTPLGSATADGNGRFTYFTTQLPDSPRFYRAVTTSEPVPAQ